MVKELINILTGICIKEIGKMIKNKVKGLISGKMETNFKENFIMILWMDLEFLFLQMENPKMLYLIKVF